MKNNCEHYVKYINVFLNFKAYLKNEFVCKTTHMKDLTIPELIWQELGGINKQFV